MNRRDFIRIGLISAAAVGLRNILPALGPRSVDLRCDKCGGYVITLRNFVEYKAGETQCKHCSPNGGVYINRWMIIVGDSGDVCLDFGDAENLLFTNNYMTSRGNKPASFVKVMA